MIFGVDTSFANGNVDWDLAVKSDRVEWAYSRCCYGNDAWDDDGSTFAQAHDACKRLRIPFSAYMFWLGWEDGSAQAQHFFTVANGRYGTNAEIVDVEEGSFILGNPGVNANIANLDKTLSGIQAKLGQPMIYTNADTWATYFGNTDAFSGHRVIVAQFDVPPLQFDPIPGLPNVVAHQFSNGSGLSPIPGLSRPDNNADRDVCADLSKLVR